MINFPLLVPSLVVLLTFATQAFASTKSETNSYLPVLFVHGHGLYPEDWDYFRNYFAGHAYPEKYLYALKIEPNTVRNRIAAEQHIAPVVDKLLRQTGSTKINIIAHSMGAVSTRWYANRIAPEKVNAWISIAGSNHGTNVLCKYNDPAAREMCPAYSTDTVKNAIQTDLNGTKPGEVDESPYGFGVDSKNVKSIPPTDKHGIYYWTIRIAVDEWIEPGDSAILDGAGGLALEFKPAYQLVETSPGNFLYEEKGFFSRKPDHCSLLRNKVIADFVLRLIQRANKAAEH